VVVRVRVGGLIAITVICRIMACARTGVHPLLSIVVAVPVMAAIVALVIRAWAVVTWSIIVGLVVVGASIMFVVRMVIWARAIMVAFRFIVALETMLLMALGVMLPRA
jgi:hypothetical protein